MQGGKRQGAGRKKGGVNSRTAAIAQALANQGMTPLGYMLEVMRDETVESSRRDDMSKAAAPYVHPRLASVEHGGKDGKPIQFESVERVIVRK